MGANASYLRGEQNGSGPETRPKLDDIPESCMALVLSYLDPPEIAKLAGLSRTFRSASSADFIWIPKLPSTYECILSKLPDGGGAAAKGKKDIYSLLCSPHSFDSGTKEVWIDKVSGGVCLSISSKAMNITGIKDRRYWNYIASDESRFQSVAYLHQIWWLEIVGELEFRLPAGTYSLYFRLLLGKVSRRLGRRVCNNENTHGWDSKPVQFQLKTHEGQHAVATCKLGSLGNWVNYHVGDFAVNDSSSLTKIRFSLTQIDCTHTKGGLCVDSVFICPASLGKLKEGPPP